MSHHYAVPLVNDRELTEARAALGAALPRILRYFGEDSPRSVARIEEALAAGDAAMMVLPAHLLKGEARQLGCRRLADIAEAIETTAQRCLETHDVPGDAAAEVAMLRACLDATLAALEARVPATSARPTERAIAAGPIAPGAAPGARVRLFGRRTRD